MSAQRVFRVLLPLSFLFTYFFFAEYLPPLRSVHIPYDLQGYHYPLNDYAFQAIKTGRLPEWDPTIYSGMPFTGNLQTQSFYPPMWLLYLANWHRARLSYLTLEIFVFLHVWLTFVLGYIWLSRKQLLPLAAVLGAGVLAYSGYMMLQLQHLGLIAAYTWIPLGFWSIDRYIEDKNLRFLWTLGAASALAFLAGYPPTWVVFAVCMVTYAALRFPWNWRPATAVAVALCLSLLPCLIQLLPALEAAGLKEKTQHYGPGIKDPLFYLSYLVPNYFDFGLKAPIMTNFGYEYLYLGAAGLLGLFLAAGRGSWRKIIPFVGVAAVCLIVTMNPLNLVWFAIQHSPMLFEVLRGWYFLAGVTAAVAGVAAIGFDAFLRKGRRSYPVWVAVVLLALMVLWIIFQIRAWLPRGSGVPVGWTSLLLTAASLLFLAGALLLYRSVVGPLRAALAAGIVLLVATDYKVFGTSLRMNAAKGDVDRTIRSFGLYPGMSDANYLEIRSHPEFRVLDDLGNSVLDMRHYGLASPQGADPLMPKQYRALMGGQPGGTLRDIDAPNEKDLLRRLAVRYVISFENAPRFARLAADPEFRPLPWNGTYFHVFELLGAQPALRWDKELPGSAVRLLAWKPERREAQTSSAQPGKVVLLEQMYPGWEAWVDGRKVPIFPWDGAFQSVPVGAGSHRVTFVFRSASLRGGAVGSAVSLAAMGLFLFQTRKRRVEVRP